MKVWHAINPTFGMTEQSFPNDYELVAEIDCETADEAFKLTNHIDRPWWENDLKVIKESRSSSVGDIVEIEGKILLCLDLGWKELKKLNAEKSTHLS